MCVCDSLSWVCYSWRQDCPGLGRWRGWRKGIEGLGGKVGVWRGIPLGTLQSAGPLGHGNLRVTREAPRVHWGGTSSQRDNEIASGNPASCLEKQPPVTWLHPLLQEWDKSCEPRHTEKSLLGRQASLRVQGHPGLLPPPHLHFAPVASWNHDNSYQVFHDLEMIRWRNRSPERQRGLPKSHS